MNNLAKPVSSFYKALKSAGAAFFGVQSEKNLKDDFEQPQQPLWYLIAGITLAACFLTMLMILILWITQYKN